MAGVGMAVGHDAIHDLTQRIKKTNKLVSNSFNLIGASAKVWEIQHNVLHHTYPNIDHADDDINTPFFFDFHLMLKSIGYINFNIFIFGFFTQFLLWHG